MGYDWRKAPKWLNALIGLDQFGNTLFNLLPWPFTWPGVGNPDRTISYTLGQLKAKYGGKIPWRWPVAKLIDAWLEWIDPGHSLEAYKNNT